MKLGAAGLAALVVLTTSCADTASDEAKVPLGGAPADSIHQGAVTGVATPLQAQLDSGNLAFRADDYTRARAYYLRATEMDSTFAPAWFGLYMAEDKLGNKEQADAAMKRARDLNPAFGEPHEGNMPTKAPAS